MVADEIPYWYAIRVTYSREMIVKDYCDKNNIINFIPLAHKTHEKNGSQVRILTPVVHNLIFIKATRTHINNIKLKYPIRYIIDKATNLPIIVPEASMQHFIAVAGNYDQQIIFLNPSEINAKVATKVRIKDGIFRGVEGVLMKVKNNKRVVVQVAGLMVVATHYIHPSLIEIIE